MHVCLKLFALHHILQVLFIVSSMSCIKRPIRDACLHMGGILAEGSAGCAGSTIYPPCPPAPQVCLPIASLLADGISLNLAHILSSPGKIL